MQVVEQVLALDTAAAAAVVAVEPQETRDSALDCTAELRQIVSWNAAARTPSVAGIVVHLAQVLTGSTVVGIALRYFRKQQLAGPSTALADDDDSGPRDIRGWSD